MTLEMADSVALHLDLLSSIYLGTFSAALELDETC